MIYYKHRKEVKNGKTNSRNAEEINRIRKIYSRKPPKVQAEARVEIKALRTRIDAVEKALNQK